MQKIVDHFKKLRDFNAENTLDAKIAQINIFCKKQNIDSFVIGISGGIDSAVTYRLLAEASKQPDSPIKKIVALLMPIHCAGTSSQSAATKRGIMAISDHPPCLEFNICYLTDVFNAYINAMPHEMPHDSWADGQLASIIRMPNLYFHAALLQSRGFKSITVGTINRDEGCYIGFFGKASDAMVDLQPIADLHKSEVYALAKLLNVHEDIINATPSGDVWDGRNDEQMIGAPYWFLEMYISFMDFESSFAFKTFISMNVHDEDLVVDYHNYIDAIDELHEKNAHKYEVGSPSHFIDVMQRKLPSYYRGW